MGLSYSYWQNLIVVIARLVNLLGVNADQFLLFVVPLFGAARAGGHGFLRFLLPLLA